MSKDPLLPSFICCMDPIKPLCDDRRYECFRHMSGLYLCLIEDKETLVSNATLCVDMGYFHDPSRIPAFSALIELAVFLDEKEYSQTRRSCVKSQLLFQQQLSILSIVDQPPLSEVCSNPKS